MLPVEILLNNRGPSLTTPQVAPDIFDQLGFVLCPASADGVALDVLIQKFVRIQFRAVARQSKLPDHTRWTVLKGAETTRTQNQENALLELVEQGFATAYRVKELLRWVRRAESKQATKWRISHFPVRGALASFERHSPRFLHRWHSLHTNARLEGFNGLFQAARARARGYRNVVNFITMVYLIAAPIQAVVAS